MIASPLVQVRPFVRLDDRDHGLIDPRDDLFMQTRHLRKIQPGATGPEHRPDLAQRDPLDPALSYIDVVILTSSIGDTARG